MGSQRLPPGQMVDIGGFRLHALLRGQGSPAVIFEPALSGYALQYQHIQTAVSAFAQTMAYDRAGLGWSECSPVPRTPDHLVGELHTLLARLDLHPPYVLVAHSFGGLLARVYTGYYPDEVAGLVLIDAPHVDEYAPFPDMDKFIRQMAAGIRVQKIASRLGLGKFITRMSLGSAAKLLSPDDLNTFAAVSSRPHHLDTTLAEFSQHRCYFGPQSQVQGTLGDRPLVVVTAGNSVSGKAKVGGTITGDEMNVLHQKLQKDLVRLSTRGEQIVIPGATHFSILFEPSYVAQVVEAIKKVAEQVIQD